MKLSWRACTCHISDQPPVPCPHKYAITECRAAAHAQRVKEIAVTCILGFGFGLALILLAGCAYQPAPPIDWRTVHQPAPQTPN